MTKQDFVDAVAGKTGLSKRDAGEAVEALLGIVEEALKAGDSVTFTGSASSRRPIVQRAWASTRVPEREGVDQRGERAEVLRRLPAEEVRQLARRATPPSRPAKAPETAPSAFSSCLVPLTRTYVRLQCGDAALLRRRRPPRRARHRRGAERSRPTRRRASLFALACAPTAIARSLLDDVVAGDARLSWRGALGRARRRRPARHALEDADFVVFDLETTGLSPSTSRICEIGAQRVSRSSSETTFETLVNPRAPLPAGGHGADRHRAARPRSAPRAWSSLCGASSTSPGMPCSSRTTRASTWRFSTARYDVSRAAGLPRPSSTPCGSRAASSPGGSAAFGLAPLCALLRHERSSRATARSRTRPRPRRSSSRCSASRRNVARAPVADVVELAAPGRGGSTRSARSSPARRVAPGVYLFRDAARAGALRRPGARPRARLRSYFAGERQRPAVEAALAALERVEWRERARSSRRRSMSCGCCASCGRRRTRVGRAGSRGLAAPTRSTLGGAAASRPRTGRSRAAAREAGGAGARRPRRRRSARRASRLRRQLGRLASRPALRGRRPAARPHRSARAGRRASRRARAPPRHCASAWSRPRSSRASCAPSSSRAASSPAAPSRAAGGRARDRRRAGGGAARARAPCSTRRRRRAAPRRVLPAPAAARAARRRARARSDPRGGEGGSLGSVSSATEPSQHAVAAFSDRVAEAVERKRTQLVVGLDPRVDLLPVELRGEAVLGRAAAARGGRALLQGHRRRGRAVRRRGQAAGRVLRGARQRRLAGARVGRRATPREAGLLVIADAKRGDIGSTARAYAAAFLEPRGRRAAARRRAHRQPLPRHRLDRPVPLRLPQPRRRASSVLVRTSNAGGRDIQEATLSDGTPVWRHVAGLVDEWGADLVGERGMSSVGAVVGATVPRRDGRRAAGDAAGDHPPPRRRRPGRDAGRRRARLHERPGERARQRLALGHLRLSRRPRPTGARPPPPRLRGSRTRSGPRPAGRPAAASTFRRDAPRRPCSRCGRRARRCAAAAAAPPPVAAPAYVVRGGPDDVVLAARAADASARRRASRS